METSDPKEASFGQGLELANILNKAIASAVKKTGASSADVQKLISKPSVIYECIENLFLGVVVKNPAILKLISAGEKIMVEASNGKAIVIKAERTFKSYIEPKFTSFKLNEKSMATPETLLNVYEMVNPGTFAKMFTELNSDLDKLVMTQAQVICFCEKYSIWLSLKEHPTFFLIEANGEYFVACVYVYQTGLRVYVLNYEYDHCWFCSDDYHFRAIVPQ